MASRFAVRRPLAETPLWDKMAAGRRVFSFELELTARCNLDCRHCYINRPTGDEAARAVELRLDEIDRLAGQAADLGAVWCLLTGGEPLLRRDFFAVFKAVRRHGLLVSIFTNATLIGPREVALFREDPPREIEVTVYGATAATYERVTGRPGSFAAFRRGLDLLLEAGLPVSLKAMALRSNVDELEAIAEFCRVRTRGAYRFDPLLHLRLDRREDRNALIRAERLGPEEIVRLERADPERFGALRSACLADLEAAAPAAPCRHLFRCGAGTKGFTVGPDGLLRPCLSLAHPDFLYDLRSGCLEEAWGSFIPRVMSRESDRPEFLKACGACPVVNLCLWCPAHAYLETGELDRPVEEFCRVAFARAEALKEGNAADHVDTGGRSS